jgi:hypothetical protein
LLLAAVFIISIDYKKKVKLTLNKYSFVMILGSLALGVQLVVEKHLMNVMGNYNGVVLSRSMQAII